MHCSNLFFDMCIRICITFALVVSCLIYIWSPSQCSNDTCQQHFKVDCPLLGCVEQCTKNLACQVHVCVNQWQKHNDRMPSWHHDLPRISYQILGVAHLVCATSDWNCHQERGYPASRWAMDRSCLQVVRALASLGEAQHGYERWDVPKEDESMGAPWWHVQILHLTPT
jgi:hypothetical protein